MRVQKSDKNKNLEIQKEEGGNVTLVNDDDETKIDQVNDKKNYIHLFLNLQLSRCKKFTTH